MKIITAEGKVIEGQPLTDEEVSILAELVPAINDKARNYIREEDCKLVSQHIISTYFITRRNPVVEEVEQPASVEVMA